jgi:hypothetical protein
MESVAAPPAENVTPVLLVIKSRPIVCVLTPEAESVPPSLNCNISVASGVVRDGVQFEDVPKAPDPPFHVYVFTCVDALPVPGAVVL